MNENVGIDLYRPIYGCVLVVVGWFIQIVGFGNFSHEAKVGPPKVNVVEMPAFFLDGANSHKSFFAMAKEKGFDPDLPFVSAESAAEMRQTHEVRKCGSLCVGILGLLLLVFSSFRLSGNWGVVIATIVLGPCMLPRTISFWSTIDS